VIFAEGNPDRLSAEKARQTYDTAIYAALYDFVEKQAAASRMDMILPREVFLLNIKQHPNCVDTSLFAGLDDRTCIYAMFWSLLNRVPDPQALTIWETYAAKLPSMRFRRKLFQRLSHGMEARIKRVRSVPHSFDGLNQVDCFQNASRSMNAVDHFRFLFTFFVQDIVIFYLYRIYVKTLRPIRVYFRDKAKDRQEKKKAGGVK